MDKTIYKFYNVQDRKMIYRDDIIDLDFSVGEVLDILFGSDLYIPLQYIGIDDKNCKKIYKGDIVYDSSCDVVYEVVFKHGSGWCSPCGNFCLSKDLSNLLKVLGNAFEK